MVEAAQYSFNNIDRITLKNYVPDDQDILHAKFRTTGIPDLTFDNENTQLTVVDVGGQRSERRKLIHYFEGVDIIMCMASLTDYDMPVNENPNKNAMDESVEIFASLINSRLFNPIRPGLFSRSPGPGRGGGSEAQMPKIKVNINRLK